jgi:hypothetical protein
MIIWKKRCVTLPPKKQMMNPPFVLVWSLSLFIVSTKGRPRSHATQFCSNSRRMWTADLRVAFTLISNFVFKYRFTDSYLNWINSPDFILLNPLFVILFVCKFSIVFHAYSSMLNASISTADDGKFLPFIKKSKRKKKFPLSDCDRWTCCWTSFQICFLTEFSIFYFQ